MADISSMNGVAAGSISTINGVAKASCATLHGLDMPASGASLWCISAVDGGIATAAASDLNAWTAYVSANTDGNSDYEYIAYGKDGSGDPLWVVVGEDSDLEIRYSSDPTNTSGWSDINPESINNKEMYGVAWGNNVWIAVGEDGELWRSTAGTTGWSLIDLSGVTGWDSSTDIEDVKSDGAGKWMFGQGSEVFLSTNDGVDWARVVDLGDASHINDSGYSVRAVAYTDSRWSVLVQKASNVRVYHAAASDTSTWAAGTIDGSAATGIAIAASSARHMAAGDGTVIIVSAKNCSRSTDGGQDWTKNTNALNRLDSRNVATDGNGNWVVVYDSGRVSISTDDGQNWAEQTGVQDGGSNTNLRFPTGGSNIMNLTGVATDVYLPV
jgi:hypothetical protein